jgi:hypothetical protein
VTGGLVQKLQTKQGWALVDVCPVAFWAYAVTGLLNFGLSLILSTGSEIRKATCTEGLLANDERRPLLSEMLLMRMKLTQPYEQLSYLKFLLPTLSNGLQSLVFKALPRLRHQQHRV